MKAGRKPVKFGPVASLFFLPLLFVAGALSIPYGLVRRRVVAHRERQFSHFMKGSGRTMEWASFIREMNDGHGTLIVERFSFKGPIRMWWTGDDVYEVCPYPLVDWLTMARESRFDAVRDWCHSKYTSNTGSALLVDGSNEQWGTIRGNSPLSFRDGIRYLEVPPPRRSSQLS